MRILTLSYEFPPLGGGGAKVAFGLARQLAERGHSIDVLTMGFDDLDPFEEIEGIRVFRISRTRRRTDRAGTMEMVPHEAMVFRVGKKMIREQDYDIIHCHFIFPDGIVGQYLARKAGIPLITTVHGSDVPGYNPDRFQWQHKLLLPAWRYTVARTDLLVSPSKHMQQLIKQSDPSARCQVIPNGFDPDRLSATRPRKNQILICTRMFKRKGVQYVLEAVSQLKSEIPVQVVGDGPFLPELKALAARLRINANFLGWLDNDSPELAELYETSKIFVFTSDQENFPINLLEAMCAGNAIITTDASGTREVVGDAAILVPPQDAPAIAAAIERLEDDAVCKDLSTRARTRMRENFSWDVVTTQYENAMQGLLGKDDAHSTNATTS